MTGPLQLTFVTSAVDAKTLPNSPAEVAVVGRSNVGKSSLINALANHKQLARVSKTPGRTQLINLFSMPNGSTLVDLPGYGYAAVPGRVKQGWQKMIEGYLLDREELVNVFVLVDGEIGPTKLDVQMLTWLRASQIPHTVVATKHDKVKSAKRATRKKDLAAGCMLERCMLEPGDIVWVSASKGVGIEQLRSLVYSHLTL
ncbi:MAG: GTP-binding protein EngB [Actinomycetota bacterium]